jgi:hypothetical protein
MRAVPAHVITSKIDELDKRLAALSGVPFCGESETFLKAQVAMLKGLIDAGEASADDLLDRKEAMEWSGLGKDALDNYPHAGSYSEKRWRRGHLPVRDPFGTPTPGNMELDNAGRIPLETESEAKKSSKMGNARTDPAEASRDEILQRSLEESFAA